MFRSWKFWVVVLVLGVGLGLGAGWVTVRVWANYHAGRMLSADGKIGSSAIGHWGVWMPDGTQRLARKRALMREINRRLPDAPDAALARFLAKFHFRRYMDSPLMPNMRPALHDLLERNSSRAMVYRQDLRYPSLAFNFAINDMFAEVEPHLLRMVEHGDAELRGYILGSTQSLLKRRGEAIIASMLDDPEPSIARRAWLSMAFMDPISGYSGNWRGAADGVAEAILYAAVATSDRPEALLEEVERDDALRARFGWVIPFLDRAAAMRRGERSGRGPMTDAARAIVAGEYLFEDAPPPPEGGELAWRRATVAQTVGQLVRGPGGYEEAFRALFDDHPLPGDLAMDARQRAFAGDLLRAWWFLNMDDYTFDEEAAMFRRIEADEKGPE